MAKSPRKATKYSRKKSVAKAGSQYPKQASKNPRPVGGKNASKYFNYNNNNNPGFKNRRFSIAESSSLSGSFSGSDDDATSSNIAGYHTSGGKRFDKYAPISVDGDSDSSLTAVSEEDEIEASRRGSLFEDFSPKRKSKTSNPRYAKKRAPKKTFNWKSLFERSSNDMDFDEDNEDDNSDSNGSDDNDDDDDDDDDSDNNAKDHLKGLYAILNHQVSDSESGSQSGDNDDEDEEEEYGYSSSDDSEVDFVRLQAEHKKKSMKAVRAMNTQSPSSEKITKKEKRKSVSEGVDKKSMKKRNSIAKSKSKFGRRKSEVALPEDINFTFDFDDFNDNETGDKKVLLNDDPFDHLEFPRLDVDKEKSDAFEEEEDIGEEVTTPDKDKKYTALEGGDIGDLQFDFDFESQLLPVPKFKEGELNSDDDYEIDDNALVATLQDDDEDDLLNEGSVNHTRNNSIGSIEDEKDSAFLKEEEAYLVNEFESNGFDEDGQIELGDVENRNLLTNGLNHFQDDDNDQVLQYASSDDMDDNENDMEDDDYIDFVNFEVPFFESSENDDSPTKLKKENPQVASQPIVRNGRTKGTHQLQGHRKHKKERKSSGLDVTASDDEDDSYLWNYFFSSDNESNANESAIESGSEGLLHAYDSDDEMILSGDESRSKLMGKTTASGLTAEKQSSPTGDLNKTDSGNQYPTGLDEFLEYEYDSGDSTDEDLNLPKSTSKSKLGSKVAKEVLSSKTSDHRPPVLGTWAAVSNKPFGIIDGLSTRSLITKPFDPKQRPRTTFPIISTHSDADDAMGLDELLNVSELDDADENDIRIWRDFSNHKRQVPLGAFRNKSILQNNALAHYSSLYAQHVSSSGQRRRSSNSASTANLNGAKKPLSKPESTTLQGNGVNKSGRRKSSVVGPLSHPSKSNRRRASIVEAISEGLRPTKSGLFSEAALADVEETFGDDVELMSLIRGI